jgi:hypothetical protein
MRIVFASTLALMFASAGYAADVDWKMYGGASVAGPSFCFYDANGVTRTSSSYIRVWTKCLTQKDLEGVNMDDDVGKRIVDLAARKMIAGYVPPIVAVHGMDFNQAVTVIQHEETANLSAIEPQAQFFLELNCSKRMMRRLSTSIHANGQSGFQNKPSEWEYVPPEGNVATLLKVLCPMQ